jgi:hypothetical protein
VADEVSYFSRFTVKFVEIVAAGMATAVSGYLIALFGGFLSSPAPAPVVAAPGASAVSVHQPAPPSQSVQPTLPVQATPLIQPASPAPPVSADAGEPRSAPAPETTPVAKPAARPTGNGATARKRGTPDAAESKPHEPAEKPREAAESKPRDPADKPRDAAESKPRDWESVEARVRAALANAAANQPTTPETPPRQTDTPRLPPAAAVQPRPGDEPSATGTVAAPIANPQAPMAAPGPEAPVKPDPLPAVEIKSRPVAAVEAVSPPQQPAPAEASNANEPPDLVSAIRKLPEILRNDKPVPADQAPRPPMPVGQ